MFAYALVCRQQGRSPVGCLGDDETVERVARPVERQCRTDNRSEGLFAGFQADVTAQGIEYI